MTGRRSAMAAGISCLILLAVGGFVELRPGAAARSRVYRIGFESNPPFQILDADGKLRGYSVESVERAAKRAGIKLIWVSRAFSEEAFRTRSIDLWPLMADLPERRAYAYISDPWLVTDFYVVTTGSSDRPLPADFTGTIRFTGPSVLYSRLIHSAWPQAQMHAQTATEDLAASFCAGEFPAALLASHQMSSFVGDVSRNCPNADFRARHLPGLTLRMGIGATPENAAVADRLRAEIMKMGEDGELGGILAKYAYIGFSEAQVILQLTAAERQSRALRLALGAFGAALAGMAFLAWRLFRARKTAEKANASKSEFLANMSHEIRTPLGGVIGMIELTLDSPVTDIQRDYLETARSSAGMLLEILNDVLDFSRIEAGRIELAPAEFDVRRLVADVAGLMSGVPRAKGVEFRWEVDGPVPAMHYADPARVRQVLLNLIANAVKFTDRGSVIVVVNVAESEPGSVLFQIRDTGVGISADKHRQVFEPFRQADGTTVRKYGGSGLGLAISRQLVGMMGGRIWLESQPGLGSTFSFTVPTAPGRSAVPASTAPALEPQGLRSAPCRILVAEDNRVNQKLIRALLERDGHEVTVADSGQAAVAAIHSGALFDVVLMDIQMPEMDGFQATAAIRALKDTVQRRIPIIALTANAQVGYAELCSRAGMNSYLSKPIDPVQLRKAVAEISPANVAAT